MYERELTDQEGHTLFRRAIVGRDGEAWAEIYRLYRPLLLGWARQLSANAPVSERYEDIADRALSRAWSALNAERFGEFPSLAALLAYLRACVGAVVIDSLRAEATRERAYQKLETTEVVTPEEQVVEELSRSELWEVLNQLVTNSAERLILIESFVLAQPPRAILERHHERFADVPEIYGMKRNLLNRLGRNPALRQIYEEQRDLGLKDSEACV